MTNKEKMAIDAVNWYLKGVKEREELRKIYPDLILNCERRLSDYLYLLNKKSDDTPYIDIVSDMYILSKCEKLTEFIEKEEIIPKDLKTINDDFQYIFNKIIKSL